MSNRTIEIIGWLLFVVSAGGFMVSSLKSGDIASIVGSGFFLIACIVFLVPYFRKEAEYKTESKA